MLRRILSGLFFTVRATVNPDIFLLLNRRMTRCLTPCVRQPCNVSTQLCAEVGLHHSLFAGACA